MEKFTVLRAVAAPMPMMNVDTDVIIPASYLKTIARTGLGKAAFAPLRYDAQGKDKPDFVLNQARYRGAKILIVGANFGCGSSREHAPWSLMDFGIRCIIGSSFADIFFNNSSKNGLLCVTLPQAQVDDLMAQAGGAGEFTVDLEKQTVTAPDGKVIPFTVEPGRRSDLLNGFDEIGRTLTHEAAIAAFEARMPRYTPPMAVN